MVVGREAGGLACFLRMSPFRRPSAGDPVRSGAEIHDEPAPTARPGETDAIAPAGSTVARPPFRTPVESALRHPLLVLAPVLILVALGAAVGLLRDPQYIANARINVGRADVPAFTLQGVTIGNATLAGSYARAAEAPAVLERAARDAGISVADARAQIFATPVPESTLINVAAAGGSERQAQDLANGAARGLIAYVRRSNARQQDTRAVDRYRAAQRLTDSARLRLARLEARLPSSSNIVENARLDLLTRQLRSQSLSTRVVQGMVGGTVDTPPDRSLQLLVPAVAASSDFSSKLQRAMLIGLAAGVVLGLVLALLRANAGLIRRRPD